MTGAGDHAHAFAARADRAQRGAADPAQGRGRDGNARDRHRGRRAARIAPALFSRGQRGTRLRCPALDGRGGGPADTAIFGKIEPRTPSALLASIVDGWRSDLTNEEFSAGCPLVAAAADTAATSEHLRDVLRQAFDGWLTPLSEGLIDLGVPPERSDGLAIVIISALEGAIILARIRRDLTPFDALVSELGPLLDEVATPALPE
jgi:hypothetical protein